MKALWFFASIAVVLAGCNRPKDAAGLNSDSPEGRGRYSAVGIYNVGRMWTHLAGVPAPKDAAAARLTDDEQIIVVVDSRTGELRQCGNVSGFCIGMNPWTKPAALAAPVALQKHTDEIAAEEAEQLKAQAKSISRSAKH